MNIGSLFSRHARYRPEHLAVVFNDQRLTYFEFNRRINRLANCLHTLGISKGDKVATILPNCVELLEVYWAVAKIGAVVVPMSTLLMEKALVTLLNDSDTALVVTHGSFVEVIEQRQGLKISCLEEIAYSKGFINLEQLEERGNSLKNSQYGQYILDLCRREK